VTIPYVTKWVICDKIEMMMDVKIVSYVMSGGIGSRLWPLSREDFPKQFHDFSAQGQGSMLARTLKRLQVHPRARQMPIYVIGAQAHETHLRSEIEGQSLHGGRLVLEPIGRNTAAAVALATQITLQEHDDALMLILPSDHEIASDDDFWASIEAGIAAASAGRFVTFGVKPDRPETGYGYLETGAQKNGVFDVVRFVEKPDLTQAKHYLESGKFLWNSGIFLFSSKQMKRAFKQFAPQIWLGCAAAYAQAYQDITSIWLPAELYRQIPADSVDYAIMEQAKNVALVPARFRWNDLGSWQALLDLHKSQAYPIKAEIDKDEGDNVIIGDVVAIDCSGSYLRSQSGLLSAVGLRNMAVVKTADATFVAPVDMSQNVRQVVAELEKSGRLEAKFTPSSDNSLAFPLTRAAHASRVRHWLQEEALPLWANSGVDDKGGFYEKLGFDARPIAATKRMRTMARQIYVFAMAHKMGCNIEALPLIDHGLSFIVSNGRGPHGGWIRSFDAQGGVLDATEDLYDQAFVLLALAHAHAAGHTQARPLMEETLTFLDAHLADADNGGFFENPTKDNLPRRSNPHMHLLEAFLAWFDITGEAQFLQRAGQIVNLFQARFFDPDSWTLGEYFTSDWQRAAGKMGEICEPGHHFEWAWLLTIYAKCTAKKLGRSAQDLSEAKNAPARKLYASTLAYGINRTTGLCFNKISKSGQSLDLDTRSWQQTEALKAVIGLDDGFGPDLKPEIEARVGRLLRWHIDPAPQGLWIDAIDVSGRGLSKDVPASILYHLVSALTYYLGSLDHNLE